MDALNTQVYHAITHPEKRDVKLVYCSSDEQIAYIMTKPLPRNRFLFVRAAIRLLSENHKVENVEN